MKITVITVAYNSATTILDTIRSVARQSHSDLEHLVIDGGSTDATVEIVEANRHANLVIKSEPDRGIYDAMNKGLNLSTGEIFGFLNSDDLYADSDALLRVAKAFDDDPSIEACFGDLVYVSADNRKVIRYWKSRSYQADLLRLGWCPAHPTFYVRRSALTRLGNFDISYRLAADAEFMIRYLGPGAVRSVYIPKVQVRMRMGGVSNKSWNNIFRGNLEILKALKKNDVDYSIISFAAHKLVNRFWQRLTASYIGKTG